MTEQPAHSPVPTDPCADCVVGRSPGFPRYRWAESKWTGQPVRQHAQTSDHYRGAPLNWTPLTNLRVSATAKKQRRQS